MVDAGGLKYWCKRFAKKQTCLLGGSNQLGTSFMWNESKENVQPLRTGLTTGTCATACAMAAAWQLLTGRLFNRVDVTLPKGKVVELRVSPEKSQSQSGQAQNTQTQSSAIFSTIKDAGDDPDVTHGAKVSVLVELLTTPETHFYAGDGVGTVTRSGLVLAVGEPAINPVPRQMITEHLLRVAQQNDYSGGFAVTVSIENGEALALKTMNPRLGIVGGLSILGTSGIVRPFSCGAWIASIYQGIDVAKSNGFTHIAASTGNTSEHYVKELYQLEDMALIEMGDFAGAVLKHLKKVPVPKLSLCAGFGKLSKLANGHMDLNSRSSSIDFEQLAQFAKASGASDSLVLAIQNANTAIETVAMAQKENIDLAAAITKQAFIFSRSILPEDVLLEVIAIDRQGKCLANIKSEGFDQ